MTPKSKSIDVFGKSKRLDDETYARLQKIADRECEGNISQLVRKALREWIDGRDKKRRI